MTRFAIILMGLSFLLASCGGAMTPTPTPVPPPTPLPTATPRPTATSTPEAPTAKAVYERVSPSIAFIDVPSGTGTGVLREDGYLITNAHVVWPFAKARVVFANGAEIEDAPVVGSDLMADLAVLGPLAVDLPGLPLGDGESLGIGSRVYLIGYPGEVEKFPQPSLSQGLISRRREWEQAGITYLQADAATAGGQSGGALVSEDGEVIGITGFSLVNGNYALAASAADVRPRIQALIAGEDADQLGDRRLLAATPKADHTILLENRWRLPVFIVDEPPGTQFEAQLLPVDDYAIEVYDVYGEEVASSYDSEIGINHASFDIDVAAPYFLHIVPTSEEAAATVISLSGSKPFWRLNDRDDGQLLKQGEVKKASIDIPGESDTYRLALQKGDEVTIKVDSILLDAALALYDRESVDPDSPVAFDDDSGGGLFGINPALTYRPPKSGLYEVVVFADVEDIGGYFISVGQPYEGAPTAVAPTPTPTPIASEVGAMRLYRFPGRPRFSLQYPAFWQDKPTGAFRDACEAFTACFTDANGALGLMIDIDDLEELGLSGISQEEYANVLIADLQDGAREFELLDRRERTSAGGRPVVELEYVFGDNQIVRARRLIAVSKNVGFSAAYVVPPVIGGLEANDDVRAALGLLERIIDYSFASFTID
jgi:S1-C subfamily serine protease